MKTLREVLGAARQNQVAVGHFNISDLAGLKAVFESARALDVPVIVGLSEGERAFMGVREAAAAVKVLRHDDYPIFLNADHTHSLASAEDQVVPYKLLPAAVDAMKQVVSGRLLLFNGRSGDA